MGVDDEIRHRWHPLFDDPIRPRRCQNCGILVTTGSEHDADRLRPCPGNGGITYLDVFAAFWGEVAAACALVERETSHEVAWSPPTVEQQIALAEVVLGLRPIRRIEGVAWADSLSPFLHDWGTKTGRMVQIERSGPLVPEDTTPCPASPPHGATCLCHGKGWVEALA